jgi:hypothetical protein
MTCNNSEQEFNPSRVSSYNSLADALEEQERTEEHQSAADLQDDGLGFLLDMFDEVIELTEDSVEQLPATGSSKALASSRCQQR